MDVIPVELDSMDVGLSVYHSSVEVPRTVAEEPLYWEEEQVKRRGGNMGHMGQS